MIDCKHGSWADYCCMYCGKEFTEVIAELEAELVKLKCYHSDAVSDGQKLEAELARRDEPCVWTRLTGGSCGLKRECDGEWNTIGAGLENYCGGCGHTIEIEDKSA